MSRGNLLEQLMTALRMAFHLLERDREAGRRLAAVLAESMDKIGHCRQCRTLTEAELCPLCASSNRQGGMICVVESPAEVAAIEQSACYSGLYFVLGGRLSPIDGIGPEELGLGELQRRLAAGGVEEIILATSPTMEGEATAHYIHDMANGRNIKVTRIAHGVPLGGELEYVDSGTLAHALSGRREF